MFEIVDETYVPENSYLFHKDKDKDIGGVGYLVARFANSWGVNLNLVTLVCSDVLTETEVFLQHVHVRFKQFIPL